MAYLQETLLNAYLEQGGNSEFRPDRPGLLDAVIQRGTPFINKFMKPSTVEQLRTMIGTRQASIPVLKDQEVIVNRTPGFANIPANLLESANYQFAAYDVFSGFQLFPSSFAQNQIDMESYVSETMNRVLNACAVEIESILTDVAELRKTQTLGFTTQVSQGDGVFTFDAPTDTLQINKAAQEDTMYWLLHSLMRANKLPGDYSLVTSPAGLTPAITEAAKFGPSNQKNLQFQATQIPLDRYYESDSISPGSDVFNGYFMQDGALGIIENFPPDFVSGTTVGERNWSISNAPMNGVGLRANVFMNREASDASTLFTPINPSLKMSHWEEMALWFRFYVVYPYNSNIAGKAQNIVKIKGLTT